MEIKPNQPTIKGPGDWFTGDVWIDSVVQPHDHSTLNVAAVHFTPGARSAWHVHDGGQTLYVTEGEGRVQSRGEPSSRSARATSSTRPQVSGTGTGAAPDHFMTHLSLTEGPATWGDQVTDDAYGDGT